MRGLIVLLLGGLSSALCAQGIELGGNTRIEGGEVKTQSKHSAPKPAGSNIKLPSQTTGTTSHPPTSTPTPSSPSIEKTPDVKTSDTAAQPQSATQKKNPKPVRRGPPPIKLIGSGKALTIDCANNVVFVDGTGNNLRLLGACSSIFIQGSSNIVIVDQVGAVKIEGTANSVTWRRGHPPKNIVQGASNKVAHNE